MYGKSYDGVTGLIGVNKAPQGLEAVVSQEPVYDLYRYLYGDGMRRANAFLTPALYDLIDFTPGADPRRARTTSSTAPTTPSAPAAWPPTTPTRPPTTTTTRPTGRRAR